MPVEDLLTISQLTLNKHSGKLSEETSRPLLGVLQEYLPRIYLLHIYGITQTKLNSADTLRLIFFHFQKMYFDQQFGTAKEATRKTLTMH